MFPKIYQIYEKIKQNQLKQIWLGKKEAVIKAIKLLKKNQMVFEPDILYLGRLTDLPSCSSLPCECNLVCLEEEEEPMNFTPPSTINLALIASAASLEDLLNEVQDILLDSSYFIRSSASLLNSIIQGRGLHYIMEIGSELLGNPIMLGDSRHRILAYSKCDDVEDAAWTEVRDTGYCTFEYTLKYDFKKLIEMSAISKLPVIGDLGPTCRTKRIFAKVVVDNKIVGHLAVLEHRKPFTSRDIEVVSFICDLLSSEMQKNKHYLNTRNVMLENLLISLLREEYSSKEPVLERIKYLNWKLQGHLYVLAIKYNNYEDTFDLIPYIRDSLKNIYEENTTVFYENHLLLLTGCPDHLYLSQDDFQELKKFLHKNKLVAGISQAFSDITALRKHFKQALISMQLGQKLGKEDILFEYESYAVYHMLDICCNHYEIREFCHPALRKLLDIDQLHKTEYLKSLIAYIMNMRNLGAAADALFIHRNTMSYRLTKIKELTGLDFNNDDLNFNLFISYKLMEYSGKL